MAGEDREREVGEDWRITLIQGETNGRADRAGDIDRADMVLDVEHSGILCGNALEHVVGPDDVLGGERLAVVPLHIGTQVECYLSAVGRYFPAFGQIRLGLHVVVEMREAGKDDAGDVLGIGVEAREPGVERLHSVCEPYSNGS